MGDRSCRTSPRQDHVRRRRFEEERWTSVSIRGFAWGQVLWGSFPRPPWWTFDLTLSPGRLGSIDSQIALLPLEDAIGLERQPNMPGTIDQYPNWRHRYAAEAATLLDDSDVRHRIETLANRGAQ